MKLTREIKERIDQYFDNISSEDLYFKAISEYGFKEMDLEIDNQNFQKIKLSFYHSKINNGIDPTDNDGMPLAA